MADIRPADRAHNGVADRVHKRVGIGMAIKPLYVRYIYTAQNKLAPLH
jgi:hypothetical protein